MNTLIIIVGAILAIIGFLVSNFKLYNLIAGYNTMSENEKKNYDIKGYAKLMRNVFLFIGLSSIVGAIINYWLNIKYLSTIVFLSSLFCGLFYLLTKSSKFHSKQN